MENKILNKLERVRALIRKTHSLCLSSMWRQADYRPEDSEKLKSRLDRRLKRLESLSKLYTNPSLTQDLKKILGK